jgi:hypothetical protein
MNELLPVYALTGIIQTTIIGALLTAISITLQIFSACVSDNTQKQ